MSALAWQDQAACRGHRLDFTDGRRPHGEYRCEFATLGDHQALAEVLHESPSTVFLSGYHSDLYDDLYAGWHRIERRVVRGTAAVRAAEKPHATEVIWSNRPLNAPARLFEVAR